MPLSFIHGPLLMLAASSLFLVAAREKVILLIGHDFSRRRAFGVSASHLPPMMVPDLITLLLINGLGGRSIGSGRTNRRRRRRRVAFRVCIDEVAGASSELHFQVAGGRFDRSSAREIPQRAFVTTGSHVHLSVSLTRTRVTLLARLGLLRQGLDLVTGIEVSVA